MGQSFWSSPKELATQLPNRPRPVRQAAKPQLQDEDARHARPRNPKTPAKLLQSLSSFQAGLFCLQRKRGLRESDAACSLNCELKAQRHSGTASRASPRPRAACAEGGPPVDFRGDAVMPLTLFLPHPWPVSSCLSHVSTKGCDCPSSPRIYRSQVHKGHRLRCQTTESILSFLTTGASTHSAIPVQGHGPRRTRLRPCAQVQGQFCVDAERSVEQLRSMTHFESTWRQTHFCGWISHKSTSVLHGAFKKAG